MAARGGKVRSTQKWHTTVPDYGFYRGRADEERFNLRKKYDPGWWAAARWIWWWFLCRCRGGEFGWTLPDGDRPLSFQDLSQLLPDWDQRVKVPLWFDATVRGALKSSLELWRCDVVGIIDQPPASTTGADHPGRCFLVLSQDSTTPTGALEPVMTRLSLRSLVAAGSD
jgi:hypothetical protein